jgi:catechol 2,3-dioxygenase-like lactoylglutathione lyase family enzyme
MLQHIALTVNDSEEIENFYEDVLLFTLKHRFSVDDEVCEKLFNVPERTDVYVMRFHNAELEIFINKRKERKVFSHICLSYWKAYAIYDFAAKKGYKTILKKGTKQDTYFIWDRSGNMFEIKEITE